jgi:hypothetical protein
MKFTACVLPGVELVLASPRRLSRQLMSDDLPTLDLPEKAISGSDVPFSCAAVWALLKKAADSIFT